MKVQYELSVSELKELSDLLDQFFKKLREKPKAKILK